MKRKLKKVLLMVSLVLMMGLVGCGCGSVAEKPLEIIADFVGMITSALIWNII